MIASLTRVPIGPRLLAAFSVLLLSLLALCAYTLVSLRHLSAELQDIKDNRVPKVESLARVADNVELIASEMRSILIFRNAVRQQEWTVRIHKAQQNNADILRLLKPETGSREDLKLMAEAEQRAQSFDTDVAEFLARCQDGDSSDAATYLDSDLDHSQLALTQVLNTIKNRETARIGLTTDAAAEIATKAGDVTIAIAISVAIAIVTAVTFSLLQALCVGPRRS